MVPELVYCAGGNPRYAEIAINAGYKYGSRLPGTPYAPLWFADQNWRAPVRASYMAALARFRPECATVLDLERESQLPEVLDWAEEAAQYARRVIIIPKAHGIIRRLPRQINGAPVVLGYSIPTSHGGTMVWHSEFAGWPIHLLGGSPHAQMRHWSRLRAIADVVSADGNMSNKISHAGRFWRLEKGIKGNWVNLREIGVQLPTDNNIEAFRRSCENIQAAWQHLREEM